ncbi:hypothetical protein [Kitasatospora sp. NPDC059827]|uniref:hypothetical protein n=1 Tax=Kitasatospora sp. NPDC059827 TaxID=3346964 RepID=UPI0036678849
MITSTDREQVRADLLATLTTDTEYADGFGLDPFDLLAVDNAAALLADANALDEQVRSDGRMVSGGTRHGVMVLHPGIAQAERNRTAADRILRQLRPPSDDGPKRGHNGHAAARARWGDRI